MTVYQKIMNIVKNGANMETDSIEKLVYIAYWVGREQAVKEVSDMYKDFLTEQVERAKNCRYYKMAVKVQGGKNYLYHPDYGYAMTGLFGSDETEFLK